MDIGDVFGDFPSRPTHDDFWKLSSAVLRLDGRMEDFSEPEGDEQQVGQVLSEYCDPESLVYMAQQRSLRLFHLHPELKKNSVEIMQVLLTSYIDGFCAGAELERSRH